MKHVTQTTGARYAREPQRELPRISLTETARDFHAFAQARRGLADLHLSYGVRRVGIFPFVGGAFRFLG